GKPRAIALALRRRFGVAIPRGGHADRGRSLRTAQDACDRESRPTKRRRADITDERECARRAKAQVHAAIAGTRLRAIDHEQRGVATVTARQGTKSRSAMGISLARCWNLY